MIKHAFPSNPSSLASSAFASCSLDRIFSRDSTGNQSAIKFINAQSTLADGARLENAPSFGREREYSLRLAVSTQGDRHIGQFGSPCFCIFTKHLVRELVHLPAVCYVCSPDAKKMPTGEADWLESYGRAYDTRIIVDMRYNGDYGLPNSLDEELRQGLAIPGKWDQRL